MAQQQPPQQSPAQQPPVQPSPQFVDKQFYVAVLFILGFFIALIISLYNYFVVSSLQLASFVGTLFGGWVGTIIGFYFGQKPAEQLRQNLSDERQRSKDLTDYIQKRSDDMWKKVKGE